MPLVLGSKFEMPLVLGSELVIMIASMIIYLIHDYLKPLNIHCWKKSGITTFICDK